MSDDKRPALLTREETTAKILDEFDARLWMTARSTDYAYQGRPIAVNWESTPALYSAIFSSEYDGAPDAGFQPMGFGKTEAEAVADLIDIDQEMERLAEEYHVNPYAIHAIIRRITWKHLP